MNTSLHLRPPFALALGTGVLAAWLSILAIALASDDSSTPDPTAVPNTGAAEQPPPTPRPGRAGPGYVQETLER
jgi:hypothetical protein